MSSSTPAILVVDDNPANRRLYTAILKDSGAELLTAGNGEEALALAAQRRYAMVLLDVHLPGPSGSGFEVAQRLHALQPDDPAPIVFVSAVYVHETDAYRGYRLGAVDYVLSPVVPEILRAKAEVFIRLQRMREQARAQAEATEAALRDMRSAYAELERFSSAMSHDLRTPVAQIIGLTQLLQIGLEPVLQPQQREYLALMEQAAHRMNGLIDDLLTLAMMRRAELRMQRVDLSALAGDVARELAAQDPQRQVDWRLAPGLVAVGDARMLRTVLANLLGNAWKYSARQPRAVIEFDHAPPPAAGVRPQPAFVVRDNGAGFDVAAAGERLFRPFQRFHPMGEFPGTGLGLSIVQCAVEKHGGTVWVESQPAAGTAVTFTLPAALETT
jgi:signal transduction histidine kinase